jgi:hypothetical protein
VGAEQLVDHKRTSQIRISVEVGDEEDEEQHKRPDGKNTATERKMRGGVCHLQG